MFRPPFISGTDRDSFAAFTLTKRFPHIIDQVLRDNVLNRQQIRRLEELREEILHGHIPFEAQEGIAHSVYWAQFLKDYGGSSYYDIPFFVVESYIYFRMAQIAAFDVTGHDFFLPSKLQNIESNIGFVKQLAELQQKQLSGFTTAHMRQLLLASLWGNSADLSQITDNAAATRDEQRNGLLIDCSEPLCEFIGTSGKENINYIADNAGLELITDLFLIDYILFHRKALSVILHVKQHPTFVSDAIEADINHHLSLMAGMDDVNCNDFAARIQGYINDARLVISDHPFWNTGAHFTALPRDIISYFAKGSLIVIKGDANYRRLFEDRMWPMTTRIEDVLHYLSEYEIASIRTLKSEIILGLEQQQVDYLTQHGGQWLTNGSYGIIMFRRASVS